MGMESCDVRAAYMVWSRLAFGDTRTSFGNEIP